MCDSTLNRFTEVYNSGNVKPTKQYCQNHRCQNYNVTVTDYKLGDFLGIRDNEVENTNNIILKSLSHVLQCQ